MKTFKYGWKPDLPDIRDFKFCVKRRVTKLPTSVDLRPLMPDVYDQKSLGSCTANAIAAASEFLWMKSKNVIVPSRLFIYYNERDMEGTVSQDSGAQIRDGIKSIAKYGECYETVWPYDVSKFAVKPSKTCYNSALQHKALAYSRVAGTENDMKSALASGFPFVFGISVYDSFESDAVAKTGVVPMPKSTERVLGGHAILAVGYTDAKKQFIVRNSWGPGWGDKGYCYIPYAYLANPNLADDMWIVTSET